jgi:crotonobetaine/carnitine-CoA ligase
MKVSIPPAADVVIRYLLERNALESPDKTSVVFEDGSSWTNAEALEQASRGANQLVAAGVRQGERVAVFLPNGPDFLRAWWAIACLGAVMVPINTAFKGEMLKYAIELADPRVVVADADLATRFAAFGITAPALLAAELAEGDPSVPALERPIEVWDTHHLQLTSGTTGPSKASINSNLQFYLTGSWATVENGLDENDVFLIDLPLFHQSGLCMAACCLAARTQIAVRAVPAMSRYWEVARETGATVSFLMSSMVTFLLARPESPSDRDHSIKLMLAAPVPPDPAAFMARFGIEEIVTAYGSSEVPALTVRLAGTPLVTGACGKPRGAGFELRLVDEHDIEVPEGEPGQLIVRSSVPWSLTGGYFNDPETTAHAWRNGWFHTGDILRVDADGNYYLVDRLKDAVRRRGENISSYEVERELLAYPCVADVACVAVPSSLEVEDEVKVWLVLKPGESIDFRDLVAFLSDRMPHYMVPRYYEIVDDLPMSASMKVQKHLLRERANGPSTWDMEANGLRVTRRGLQQISEGRTG